MSDRLLAGAALVAALLSLALCLSPDLHGTDNGEFVALFARGGMAHPPGYPLYVLLAWLPLHLGSPAFSAALFSALCVLAACFLCFVTARDAGASTAGATTVAAAILGAAPVLFVAAQAEAFALHLVLVAGVVCFAGRVHRGERYSFLLALCFTLGASQHHTLIFLAPVVLVSLRHPRAWAAGIALGLTPLLMWLVADPKTQWVFAPVTSFSDLIAHLLRRMYGTFGLASESRRAPFICVLFITSLTASVPGSVLLIKRRALVRFDYALLASALLAGPVFAFMAGMDPRIAPAGSILLRFAAMPLMLFVLFAARLTRSFRFVAFACVLQAGAMGLLVHRVLDDRVDGYARTLLRAAPPSSVIVTTRDHVFFPLLALQLAEGLRPDVTIVSEPLLVFDWFRARLPAHLRFANASTLVANANAPVVFDVPSEAVVRRVPIAVFGAFAIANAALTASLDDHLRTMVTKDFAPLPGTTGCNVANDVLDAVDRARALGQPVSLSATVSACAAATTR